MSRRVSAALTSSRKLPSLAAAVSLVFIALSAGTYAVGAAAAGNHARQAPAPPGPASPGRQPVEGRKPVEGKPPTPVPANAPADGKHRESIPAPPAPASAPPRDQAARRASPQRAKHGAHAGAGESEPEPQVGGEEGGEAGAGLSAPSAQQARQKGKHGKGKQKAKEPTGKEPKSKEPVGTRIRERPREQPVTSPPPARVAVAGAAAAVPAPPQLPVPPAAVAASPQATTRSPARGSLGNRSTRHPARSSAARTSATAVAPLVAASASAAGAAPHAPRRPASAPPRRRPAHRAQSQLVTTVTRIINVIPALLWAVIAALGALALAFAASSRIAAHRAARLGRQRRELLADVGLLQAALLPELPERLGPVGTSAAYRPASGPAAGGDFYDVFALPDGEMAVIVGDVSGHGRHALPHTTLLRFTLRAYLEAGLSPRAALQAAAPVLERQIGTSFATVILATYQPRDRVLIYASAGHPPPIVAGTEPITALTACSSPPIGAGQPTGRRQTVVSLPGEALACFYTDGVVEARVGRGLFGASRLEQTLAELGPRTGAGAVLDEVAERSDRQPDDMAACLLHVEGEKIAPRVEVEELELDRRDVERGRAERFLLAGGVERDRLAEVMHSIRGAVARHGGAVVELHMRDGSPDVALRPQNVAQLHPRHLAKVGAVG